MLTSKKGRNVETETRAEPVAAGSPEEQVALAYMLDVEQVRVPFKDNCPRWVEGSRRSTGA